MTDDAIRAVLIDYLQATRGTEEPIRGETDLLESGMLDSLLVMDLVCFLEARFQVRMQPSDVRPHNLRSVSRLATYVQERLPRGSNAA